MKLINWTPNEALFNIFDNFDQYFDSNIQNNYRNSNVSINDIGSNYCISLEMPGIDKKDIEITIDQNIVNVEVQNKKDKNQSIYYEGSNHNYSNSFHIPDDGNIEKIKAKSLNGILKIDIPKLKEIKKDVKKISIS